VAGVSIIQVQNSPFHRQRIGLACTITRTVARVRRCSNTCGRHAALARRAVAAVELAPSVCGLEAAGAGTAAEAER
jgi:hypothetical protein